jgi:DNA invertase Pin-like site-specific DNA recombinase
MNGPAVIYGAKSTQDVRGSIPSQLEDCRAMASREGWQVVGEYADEAASAWSCDRGPQLAAAMVHAEQLAPCALVVQHSDRLARGDGRKARHLGEVYFWAIKAGVEIRSVQDDSTFTNPLLTFAMGERNAEDSRRKSLAVAAGMKRRAQSGKANGGPRPYGYRYADGGLVVVTEEAVIVVRVFSEFVSGRSLSAIARDLHREGLSTVRGGRWRQSTVGGILANPVYIGRVRHGGETFEGEQEAIVDTETWQRASDLLAARPKRGRGRPPQGQHLFRGGMLRCECGEAMVPRTNGGYQMYYCNGRGKLGREFCDMPHIRRSVIDLAVYHYFATVGLDLEATRAQLAGERERRLDEIGALLDQAKREELLAGERLTRIRQDYKDGRLSAADWIDLRDELTAEQQSAHAEVERLTAARADIERDDERADAEQDTLALLAEIRKAIAGEVKTAAGVDAVRAALSRLFSAFILHPQQNPRYEGQARSELVDVDQGHMIELQVRPAVVTGYSDDSMYPVLRREPLCQAKNNYAVGLPIRYASGPS